MPGRGARRVSTWRKGEGGSRSLRWRRAGNVHGGGNEGGAKHRACVGGGQTTCMSGVEAPRVQSKPRVLITALAMKAVLQDACRGRWAGGTG